MALSNLNTQDQVCVGIHEKTGDKEMSWYCGRAHVGTVGNVTADRLSKRVQV